MRRYALSRVIACEPLERRSLLAADSVIQWNDIALHALEAENTSVGPGFASRDLAMMHAAIFDAVNSIEGDYQPYLYAGTAPADASVDAAVATAAYDVLAAVFPAYAPIALTAYDAALAAIPAGASSDEGVATGQAAANAILAGRVSDGSSNQVPYTYGTDPGDYQATPPDYPAPWGPGWGKVLPFGMSSAADYLAPPPPALDSREYAKAFNEVKALGAADSTARTADQTQIALFWSYDSQSYGTPLVLYNQIAQAIAQQQGNDLVQNARLFALINIAMADAGVAVWDAKYTYDLWRPVTAIQQADTDGNPKTQADPNWTPLGYSAGGYDHRTPPFPSYISGHSAFGSAMFRVIAGFYGTDNIAFDATSDQVPGAVRHYASLSQAAKENAASRVYLGVHFSFDDNQALLVGKDIGAFDVGNLLLPVGSDGSSTTVRFPVLPGHNGKGQDKNKGNDAAIFSNQLLNPETVKRHRDSDLLQSGNQSPLS